MKISTPQVCTGFAGKEEFRVGEKCLYGALNKSDKNSCAKFKRVIGLSKL